MQATQKQPTSPARDLAQPADHSPQLFDLLARIVRDLVQTLVQREGGRR